jgi:hypothetical protein
VAVS